jgi:hypothetical protein
LNRPPRVNAAQAAPEAVGQARLLSGSTAASCTTSGGSSARMACTCCGSTPAPAVQRQAIQPVANDKQAATRDAPWSASAPPKRTASSVFRSASASMEVYHGTPALRRAAASALDSSLEPIAASVQWLAVDGCSTTSGGRGAARAASAAMRASYADLSSTDTRSRSFRSEPPFCLGLCCVVHAAA